MGVRQTTVGFIEMRNHYNTYWKIGFYHGKLFSDDLHCIGLDKDVNLAVF